MNPLAGWDGPECIADGLFRYSKYISWIRLYIDLEDGELYGGTCGAESDFELARDEGQWMRYATVLASTPAGEPVLRLYGYSTWDVVFERVSEGVPLEVKLETIEDLAAYLERCFA
jgi:hypothetical protein